MVICLLAILIPACDSSSLVLLMMYSAYKLNKQGDSTQPWCTPFTILNQTFVPCPVLTVASWPAQVSLTFHVSQEAGNVVLFSPFFFFWECSFVVIHTAKGFRVVNEAEVVIFLEFPCFFYDPMDVGNLVSGSSAFSKSSLYLLSFLVHVLLKPSLKDFEH